VMTFAELYPRLAEGELLAGARDQRLREAWSIARANSFTAAT
jgi:hypothetical protein